jgi:hypothetical protein
MLEEQLVLLKGPDILAELEILPKLQQVFG